ncbi:helix-turn-helix transcriptional regulator [Cellulomonas sp. SLBN-39]|uniref:helix-turn-helix transcriptional regulator n=1 Tax=Cellulomonas sp. SLBN-39 TaxID=2768446 RepID=UPI00116B4AE6|nr:helix-turn-helix transcriptional regulator [Cellulomonas sp. SLBN-39]TQL04154.1 helix-turn-helix protein [Cellulomonas sp. SLBN-39]
MSTTTGADDRARTFRRAELASFLRTRREAIRPQDVGLPAGGRRRTPGLRREEVAVLAQVGVSWYTWMEQGRELTVSPAILDGIARALLLSPAERSYLFEVAGAAAPTADPDARDLARLADLLDAMSGRPVYAVDRYWDVLATNALAAYVFGIEPGHNCLVTFFTDEGTARRYPFRDVAGPMMVAQFRAHAARYADDPRFRDIVEDLLARSAEFRTLWDRHVVGVTPHVDLVYDHPNLGRLSFAPTVLTPADGADLRLFVYIPKAGTPTEQALRRIV